MFETLDNQTTEDSEYHLDALDKKINDGEYSLYEVQGLFTYRPMNGEGYTIGHKICRRRFILLGLRIKETHVTTWDEWMNTTTGYGVAPANYTPLMCLMSQKFSWKNATVSDQRAMTDFIYTIMRSMGKTKNKEETHTKLNKTRRNNK